MISIPTVMESSNDYGRRPVDIPLDSDDVTDKYQAQDFWVYTGKSLDVGLTVLEPLFEQYGATTDAVVQWAGSSKNFQDLYWNWVQNQVMVEDDILLNDDDTGTLCTFQENSVEELHSAHILSGSGDFTLYQSILPPLSSRVFKLTVDPGITPVGVGVVPWNGRIREEIRSKVYIDGDSGCELVGEGFRWNWEDDKLTNAIVGGEDVYIVVSNTDTETHRSFILAWE